MKTYLLLSLFLLTSIACFSQTAKVIGENGMSDEEYERVTRLRNEIEEISKLRIAAENKLQTVGPMSGDCYDLDRVNVYINQLEQTVNAYENTEARRLCKQEAALYKELNGDNYNESLNSCDHYDYKLKIAKENLQKYRDCLNGNKSQPSNSSKEIKIDVPGDKLRTKENQLNNSQDFIANQNQQIAEQEILNQKLANDLTQTFNQISNSWAKEKDFQSKISSLTNIKSVDATSIINEAKNKAQQINVSYSQKKNDALNQGINATQNLMNSVQNEEQVIAGGLLGASLTALSQASIEKQRKEAQKELERKKDLALKPLIDQLVEKIQPTQKKYLEMAEYAVIEEREQEYINNYKYYSEIIKNAKEYILNEVLVKSENIQEKKTLNSHTAQDYYDAYLRKKYSPYTGYLSSYFLELAIDKDNSRKDWINERVLLENNNAFELFMKSKNKSKIIHKEDGSIDVIETDINYGRAKLHLDFENGKLEQMGTLINGLMNEKWFLFNDKGELAKEYFFKDNLMDGKYIKYYPSGNVEIKGDYKNGKVNGLVKYFFENGVLKGEVEYKDDIIDGLKTFYYETGELSKSEYFEDNIKNGLQTFYYKNGQPSVIAKMKNGTRDGIVRWYYENGSLLRSIEYKSNKKIAEYGLRLKSIEAYGPDGQPLDQGNLDKGNGYINLYDLNGVFGKKQYFRKGKEIKAEDYRE